MEKSDWLRDLKKFNNLAKIEIQRTQLMKCLQLDYGSKLQNKLVKK